MAKVHVEFEVESAPHFEQWLDRCTRLTEHEQGCPVGYRADDHVQLRSALVAFVERMELKLRRNDHKKNWREQSVTALFRLMMLEIEEFKVAHEFFTVEESRPELVDIANFALILWDRLGLLPQNQPADRTGSADPDIRVVREKK